ncbi:hypothetical protein PILCRDRAFT_817802 [Piloderma croceum F 1598]|uniref:Transmembrane protein n=1 Tax=Piloderma croceum (strain F 1598) TaxID=765440 RepID=A0A0C3G2T7_PILCF|nr:hypothetical protein PILCRDRAFT_817802 [Piloderma croceum F 1598]
MSLSVLTLLAINTKLLARVSAQTVSNVTCQPASAWMLNTKNQTPCIVGAYLQAQCMNGSFEVQSLPNLSSFYVPPGNGSDACTCSTVTYSLMAACGLCQDAKALNWTVWQANCSSRDIDVGGYPFDIPTETVVPTWAYLNVTVNNTFNSWAAFQEYTNSQSTATLSTTSASSSSSITATPSPTQTLPPSPSHFGVIGGSVVGGFVAAVAILLLIAAYLNRYHRNQRVPSWESESTGLIHGTSKSPQPVGQTNVYSIYSPQDLSTPYDPWDPATFSTSSAYSSQQRISVSYPVS